MKSSFERLMILSQGMREIVHAYAVVNILDSTVFEEKFFNEFQNFKLCTKFVILIKIYF